MNIAKCVCVTAFIASLVVLVVLASAPGAIVSIGDFEVDSNYTVCVPLMIYNVTDVVGGEVNIFFDSSVVHVTSVFGGDIGVTTSNINNESGLVYINTFGTMGESGDVAFAYLNLTAVGHEGDSGPLNISVISLFDVNYTDITCNIDNGTFTIKEATVSLSDFETYAGSTITVPIMIYNVTDVVGGELNISFNSSVVHVIDVFDGDIGITTPNINNELGWVYVNTFGTTGESGDVVFAYLNLTAVGIEREGSLLNLTVISMFNTNYMDITCDTDNGTFTIKDITLPVITNSSATPSTILNDNGRPRPPGTNITELKVTVTDDAGVQSVTINLSSIGGLANQQMNLVGCNLYSVTTNATAGINLTHNLNVTATDTSGNVNSTVIKLTVLRRGDIFRDNDIDLKDIMYIAKYLAWLEPERSNAPSVLVGDVVGLGGDPVGDGLVDMKDAVYMARWCAGIEDDV